LYALQAGFSTTNLGRTLNKDTMIETDFLIVGAGVVGLATARSLAKKFSN